MVGFAVLRRVAFTIREMVPSLRTEPSRSSSGKVIPVSSPTAARNASTVAVRVSGNSCAPSLETAWAIRVTALSSLVMEPWPARPVAVRVAQATPFSAAAMR